MFFWQPAPSPCPCVLALPWEAPAAALHLVALPLHQWVLVLLKYLQLCCCLCTDGACDYTVGMFFICSVCLQPRLRSNGPSFWSPPFFSLSEKFVFWLFSSEYWVCYSGLCMPLGLGRMILANRESRLLKSWRIGINKTFYLNVVNSLDVTMHGMPVWRSHPGVCRWLGLP